MQQGWAQEDSIQNLNLSLTDSPKKKQKNPVFSSVQLKYLKMHVLDSPNAFECLSLNSHTIPSWCTVLNIPEWKTREEKEKSSAWKQWI